MIIAMVTSTPPIAPPMAAPDDPDPLSLPLLF